MIKKKCWYTEGSFYNSGVMKSSFTKCYISSIHIFFALSWFLFCFVFVLVFFFAFFFALQIFNSFGILYYKQAILYHSGGWSKPVLSITMERNIETFNITGKTIQGIIILIRKKLFFFTDKLWQRSIERPFQCDSQRMQRSEWFLSQKWVLSEKSWRGLYIG